MERIFVLTEKQLVAILGKVSELPWKLADPIMEILKNATESKAEKPQATKQEKQEKKTVPSDANTNNGKKS